MSDTTKAKPCPRCKTQIDPKASKCPNCHSDLRNWFIRHPIWTIIIFLFLAGIISSAVNKSPSNTNYVSSNQATNSELNAEQKTQQDAQERMRTGDPSMPHFSDGSHVVGADIQPGTYRQRVSSPGCYFARLSGFGGTIDEIIMNENAGAPAIVTVDVNDKGFQSRNCGIWTQDLSTILDSQATFSDGTYILGTDIQGGTYKSSGGDSCYYARLSGFGGSIDEIITNENTSDPAIITIASSDRGFTSHGCGTWSKQ
ncbi:MAG: hypothetical protein WC289_00700 [Patescibacteria group bacterium]|jgi:hypothetical protein